MDNSRSNVDEFEERHGVRIPDCWERGRSLVGLVLDTHESTIDVVRTASEETLIAEPTIGFISHLLGRAYDHVCASIVCFSTANAVVEHIWMVIGLAKACQSMPELKQRMAGDRISQPVQLTMFLPPPNSAVRRAYPPRQALSNSPGNENGSFG